MGVVYFRADFCAVDSKQAQRTRILGSADRDPESGAEITDPQAKALIVNAQNCIRLYGHPFPGNLEAPIGGAAIGVDQLNARAET